jgi:membrane protease subunit (stomatin/prohibitin family)
MDGAKENVLPYGVEVARLGNFTITLKEEDEAMLKNLMRDKAYAGQPGLADTAVKMGMAQGLSSGNAATSPAAAGVSAGVGAGMGMAMGKQIADSSNPPTAPAQAPTAPVEPEAPKGK